MNEKHNGAHYGYWKMQVKGYLHKNNLFEPLLGKLIGSQCEDYHSQREGSQEHNKHGVNSHENAYASNDTIRHSLRLI